LNSRGVDSQEVDYLLRKSLQEVTWAFTALLSSLSAIFIDEQHKVVGHCSEIKATQAS